MIIKSLIDSWYFFKNHILAISFIVLPIVVPIVLLSTLYEYGARNEEQTLLAQSVSMVLRAIAHPIYAVGTIFYISSTISGEKTDILRLWKLGIRYWLPYTILSILIGVVVLFGLFLFVLPGILFAARYAFAEFDLLFNRNDPLDAMSNSWDTTKDFMWVIFGGYVVITAALYSALYLIEMLNDESSVLYYLLTATESIVFSVLSVIYTVFAYRIYTFAAPQQSTSGD